MNPRPVPCMACGRIRDRYQPCRCGAPTDQQARAARSTRAWQHHSQTAIQAEPWCHANPCTSPTTAGTPANPLTADHLTPLAAGGPLHGPTTVLCRNCNSRRGAT